MLRVVMLILILTDGAPLNAMEFSLTLCYTNFEDRGFCETNKTNSSCSGNYINITKIRVYENHHCIFLDECRILGLQECCLKKYPSMYEEEITRLMRTCDTEECLGNFSVTELPISFTFIIIEIFYVCVFTTTISTETTQAQESVTKSAANATRSISRDSSGSATVTSVVVSVSVVTILIAVIAVIIIIYRRRTCSNSNVTASSPAPYVNVTIGSGNYYNVSLGEELRAGGETSDHHPGYPGPGVSPESRSGETDLYTDLTLDRNDKAYEILRYN